MAYDFPNSPTVGQVYQGYTWDGQKWVMTFAAPNAGGVVAIKVFTASGTYTPSPNMTTALIECVGGGGAGGGAVGVAGANIGGGGGGGGEYTRKTVTAAQIGASVAVTIGAGGAANTAGFNSGFAGGDTSVGALCSAKGGAGGGAGNNVTVGQGGLGGGFGGSGGNGDFAVTGGNGQVGANTSTYIANFVMGEGGASEFAFGTYTSSTSLNGMAATGVGGGGSGAEIPNSTSTGAGGAGKSGLVVITEYGFTANVTPPGSVVLRSYLAGLTLSTAGGSASFSVAPGVATDSGNVVMMTLAAAITKTTGAWAVGSGNGSFDGTGAAPSATAGWYHVFLIRRPDTGVVDILTSNSATAPTLPTNYTQFRRIGSMKTNGSFQWVAFTQNGDEFLWAVLSPDLAPAALTTAFANYALTLPTGITVVAKFNAQITSANNALVVSPSQSGTGFNAWNIVGGTALGGSCFLLVLTNTSAQICAKSNAASSLYVDVVGWTDRRGRDT